MESLEDRADLIRRRVVEPEQDNMLKLSSHGRAAGMDMRLLPDEARPDMGEQDSLFTQLSKVDVAAERIHAIWQGNRENEYTAADGQPHPKRGGFQIVFSDLGTPNDEKWDMYNGLRDALNRPGFGGGCHSTRGWTAWQHHGSTRQSFKSARHVSRSKLAKIRNGDEEQYAGWPSSSV